VILIEVFLLRGVGYEVIRDGCGAFLFYGLGQKSVD
jgi:hypothetical protein